MKLGVFGPAFVKGKPYGWSADGKGDPVAEQAAYDYVAGCLNEVDVEDIDNVITGGGKGVEQIALKWSALNGLACRVIPPNIQQHGKELAFIFRNQEILKEIDFAILFWDGKDTKAHRLLSDAVDQKTRIMVIPVE